MEQSSFARAFLNRDIIERYYPDVLLGMAVTVQISIAVVVTGVALGLVLAYVRALKFSFVNIAIVSFADAFRAFPPLVVILLIYFGFPYIGVTLSGYLVVWLVLSLVLAAFAEEIFWSGISSVKPGQWEAAFATGLPPFKVLYYVVLPQAGRLSIPPLTNRAIAITKHTALGAVIGVPEILNEAQAAMSRSGNATPLVMGAIAYLLLFVPVVALGRWLERQYSWKRA